MGVLVSVLFYEEEENLQPVVVQVLGPLPLVQVDDPPATICVPFVLPVGENALFEQRVVGARRQLAGHLDVVVQRPEILHRRHSDNGALVLLPGAAFVVLKEPEGPGVLQRVFHYLFGAASQRAQLGRAALCDLDIVHLVDKVAQLVQFLLLVEYTRLDRNSRHSD